MGDRRSFFRFWPSSSAPTSRRASSARPTAPAPPRTTTSASQPTPPPPKPKPKSSPSSSSSPSPSRNASQASKPNQSASPSRLSPKSKSTPNASPSRKDSQTPSTPPQRTSPSRSPKPEAHEQKTEATESESNRRDEMEIAPSKSSESDALGHEKQPIDKDNSSNIEDELKPSMEVNASHDQEIEEVKEVSREETKGLPNNDEVAKQQTNDLKQGKITTSPSENEFTSDTRKRSVRVNGKVAGSHKDDILNFVNHVMHKEGSSTEPLASVIILAGENRGASLQMGSSKGREGSVHIHRGYKIKSDEVFKENTDEEGSSEHKKTNEATKVMEDQHQPETYVNNNTQGINNSIVFNSSVTEKSPGVHLTIAQVPNEDAKELKEKGIFTESKKAELSINRAENLVHEPRIRRRCLKGLMLETSGSDEGENPEKPRRHGCRVACKEATM